MVTKTVLNQDAGDARYATARQVYYQPNGEQSPDGATNMGIGASGYMAIVPSGGISFSSNEGLENYHPPAPLKKLQAVRVLIRNATATSGSFTITVRKNGSDTAMTATILFAAIGNVAVWLEVIGPLTAPVAEDKFCVKVTNNLDTQTRVIATMSEWGDV